LLEKVAKVMFKEAVGLTLVPFTIVWDSGGQWIDC